MGMITSNIARAFAVVLLLRASSCKRPHAESLAGTSDSGPGSAFEELVMADLRRPFVTDAQLSERFAQRRADFEKLIVMAQADDLLVRIAPDFTWTTTSMAWPRPDSQLGFTLERWNAYRRLFQNLGLEAGIMRPSDHPNAIYLIAQTKGLVTGGSSKGYAYSDTPLEPLCQSLDQGKARTQSRICFKPLNGKWYLYLEWD